MGVGEASVGNWELSCEHDMVRVRAMRTLENAVRRWGFYRVAGCDEVGRGCLAGPVTAGAVILDPRPPHSRPRRLQDDHRARARAPLLADHPARHRLVGRRRPSRPKSTPSTSIVLRCEAMRRAVMAIAPLPDMVLVDAFRIPDLFIAQRGVPKGDRKCSAIAAASIVAKVTRDRADAGAARGGSALRV